MEQLFIISYRSGFIVLCLVGMGLLFTFIREKEWKAFRNTLFIFSPFLIVHLILFFYPLFDYFYLSGSITILVLFTFLIITILPSKTTPLSIVDSQSPIDERDAIFHRFYTIKPGSKEFETYYKSRPEKKEIDNAIRELPELGEPGARSYHEFTSIYQDATFDVVNKISREIEWTPENNKVVTKASPEEFSSRIKGFASYLGADLVGITKLNPAYIYSHIGRSPGKWGAPISLKHKNAIAIAVEMDYEMIKHAPDSAATTESAFKYFEAAKIAMTVARYINKLGYEARAHVDGNYRVLCVPIAVDAGLGELGRLGLLITPKFGPRVRLSIVTTNMELQHDKPLNFGVQHFCSICKKCATNCPSASIQQAEKQVIQGVEKWQSEQESCYRFWRTQGSDCSVCLKVCPYSNPNTMIHNMVRWIVKRNNLSRHLIYYGDRLFYGKFRNTKYKLPDWHGKE